MHGLPPHELEALRQARRSGQRPSEMLRLLLQRDARLGPADLAVGLSQAFATSFSSVAAVNGWWPDSPGDLDDGQLDALLDPVLGRPGPDATWPVGALVGDARFDGVERVAGNPERGIYRARDVEGGFARLILTHKSRQPLDGVLRPLRWPQAPSILWAGPAAAPGGTVLQMVAERCTARDARAFGPGTAAQTVRSAIAQLATLATALHAQGATLQGVRPETIDLEGESVAGASPRAQTLFECATPVTNIPPAFETTYQAPEVLGGGLPSPASDVFTLAVLAVEWLTGRHPFADEALPLHLMHVQGGRPTGPVPAGLASALAVDPKRRPTLAELVAKVGPR